MTETYTVQNAMKSGKKDATFGEEYYVKFVESEQTFPLWFKKDPTGSKIEGEINGSKFKKVKKEYNPTEKPASAGKPVWKDNSDGQRQGMAINNAAAYVQSCATEIVPPAVWAKTVIGYAKALYDSSDLNAVAEPESTQEVFKPTDA